MAIIQVYSNTSNHGTFRKLTNTEKRTSKFRPNCRTERPESKQVGQNKNVYKDLK